MGGTKNIGQSGGLDSARFNDIGFFLDGKDLRDAMYCLIEGEKISSEQYPSMGCNIKWK